eukprot:GHVP01054893.1.p1 GENE.GHVP01054893.1~~GHVP01054893.1.p1  ORF type:complete len:310 (+),score=39.65 GHVP01054893.1:1612-2541(+)
MHFFLLVAGTCFVVWKLCWEILGSQLIEKLGWTLDFRRYGEWAVVCGGSAGIGLAMAKEVAKRGLNIILIARNLRNLEEAKKEITKVASHSKIKIISLDLSKSNWQDHVEPIILQNIQNLDIGVLINCAAAFNGNLSSLGESLKQNNLDSFIHLNCTSPAKMLKILLPHFEYKKKGIIINVNSSSSIFPIPMLLLYSSTKAFLSYLTEGLDAELRLKYPNIICQSVCPFYVDTDLIRHIKPEQDKLSHHLVATPEDFAKAWIHTVGWLPSTSGTVIHNIWGLFIRHLPRSLNTAGCMAPVWNSEIRTSG